VSDALLVFLKEPRPGAAKTRLASAVGGQAAADLYRCLAEAEIHATAPRGDEYERIFFFSPPEAAAAMERWFPGERFTAQQGSDLGARMSAAFDEAFRRGARRAAIIGTDAPGVTRDLVEEALFSLDDHDLVLGPALDGGYYLLAVDQPRPALFQAIPWGTGSVLAATAERAGALGLSVRLLPALRDVDTLEDVRAEWPRLELLLRRDPALHATLAAAIGRGST
jgi:rSAM/selenodomain-associated transferase 1